MGNKSSTPNAAVDLLENESSPFFLRNNNNNNNNDIERSIIKCISEFRHTITTFPGLPADDTTQQISSSSSSSSLAQEIQRFRDRIHLLHPHHVVYIFTVTVRNEQNYNRSYTLRKTYRDFLSLHIALRKVYLHAVPVLIHQPHWITHHFYEPSCEERNYYGYYLRIYLQKLIELPRIGNCIFFREFFELSTQSFSALYGWKGKEGYLSLLSSAWYSRTIPCFPQNLHTVWYGLRHNYIMVYESLGSNVPIDIIYLDHNTRVYSGTVQPNEPCLPTFHINRYGRHRIRLGGTLHGHDPRSFTLQTNQGNFVLRTESLKDAEDWILAIRERMQNSESCQQNKSLASFTVPRRSVYARWMVDAQNTFAMMMRGLRAAEKEIFITGWWITPDLPLIRHHLVHHPHTSFAEWFRTHITHRNFAPSTVAEQETQNNVQSTEQRTDQSRTENRTVEEATNHTPSAPPIKSSSIDQALSELNEPNLSPEARELKQDIALKEILRERAEEGVKIYVQMYQEVSGTYALESRIQKRILKSLHPTNIYVQRHGSWFWSHHEKLIVIDRQVGFVGGLDLAWGRFDNSSHLVIDPDKKYFTGIDYYNADYADYVPPSVNEYALDRFDRTKLPRMPWHDIHCMVYGKVVDDLVYHYVQRWNYTRKSKGKESKLPILVPYTVRDQKTVTSSSGNTTGIKPVSLSSSSVTNMREVGVQTLEEYTGIPSTLRSVSVKPHRADAYDSQSMRNGSGVNNISNPIARISSQPGRRPTCIADLVPMVKDGTFHPQSTGETTQQDEQISSTTGVTNVSQNSNAAPSRTVDKMAVPGFRFRRVPLSTTEWYCSSDWSQQWNRVNIQVLRSVGEWSTGCPTESSIYHGYIHAILNAQHSIYIENQYFLSSLGWNKEELLEFEVAAGLSATGRNRTTEDTGFSSATTTATPTTTIPLVPLVSTKDKKDDAGIGNLQPSPLPDSSNAFATTGTAETYQPSLMDRYGYRASISKIPTTIFPLRDKLHNVLPHFDKSSPSLPSTDQTIRGDGTENPRLRPRLRETVPPSLITNEELTQSCTLESVTTDDIHPRSQPLRSMVRKLVPRRHRSEENVSTRNAFLFTRPFRTSSDSAPYITNPDTLDDDYQRYVWYLDQHQQGLIPKEFQIPDQSSIASEPSSRTVSSSTVHHLPFDIFRPALHRLRSKFPGPYAHIFGRKHPIEETGFVKTVETIGPTVSVEEQNRILAVNRIRSQWLRYHHGTEMNESGIHTDRPMTPVPLSLVKDPAKEYVPPVEGVYGPLKAIVGEDESKTSSPSHGTREKWQAAISTASVLGTEDNVALEASGGGIMEWDPMKNSIAEALFVRLCRAIDKRETFRTIVVLPLHPDGGPIKNSKSTKLVYYWELSTICRGGYSLIERLHRKYPTVDLNQYIIFCALRNYNYLNDVPVTEQVYVHSKLMIVDDRIVIIGSANINDRSMYGDRDSEIALLISGGDKIDTRMAGKPWRASVFAHTLRRNLWEEHLGFDHSCRYSKALPRQSLVLKYTKTRKDADNTFANVGSGSPPLWNFPFRIDNVHNPGCITRLFSPDTLQWQRAFELFRSNLYRKIHPFDDASDTSVPSVNQESLMSTVQRKRNAIMVAIAYMAYRNTLNHHHNPPPSSMIVPSIVSTTCIPSLAKDNGTELPPNPGPCTVDALQDPCDTCFYNSVWLPIARQNTLIFDHVFPASMQNSIHTLQEWKERENLLPKDKELLDQGILGKLVLYPYEFLKDEDLRSRIVEKEHYLPRKVVQ